QSEQNLPRDLGCTPDKPRLSCTGLNLVGGKKLCYLLDYVEPRFGHRSLLSSVVDDNPMPSYYELETATSPMNSRRYPVSFMPMPLCGCPGAGRPQGPPLHNCRILPRFTAI